ncbi:MAG: L,D-transpeptidase family protein, partial [Patescibacteria group bacterium]
MMPFSFKKFFNYGVGVIGAGLFGLAVTLVLVNGLDLSWRLITDRSLALVYAPTTSVQVARGQGEKAEVVKSLPPRIAPAPAGIPATGHSLMADLDQMIISLYQDGVLVEAMPIIAKGKPGSAWETPSGQYQILGQELNHFSSIGEVYMPYSLQFFGNYFIHGWPYYPNGLPVSANYSGGCLRLATDDAKKVYDFVSIGTPLLVKRTAMSNESEGYYSFRTTAKPVLTAQSFLVADLDTGEVILEKEREAVRPMASLTKLFTALVSLEVVNQFREATVSPEAVETFGDAGNLAAGDILTTGDLLYPLLLESSNDAAEVLARTFGRDNFIAHLNKKAEALGLNDTTLVDPSGIGDRNVSTPNDLFRLFQYIYRSKSFVLKTLLRPTAESTNHLWQNNSEFLARPGYLGGKSGHTTAANDTLVAGFALKLGEQVRPLALVLLGSKNRAVDTVNLLKYLEENLVYEQATRLVFVGDLMLDRAVRRSVEQAGGDYTKIFRDVTLLKPADLAFGN